MFSSSRFSVRSIRLFMLGATALVLSGCNVLDGVEGNKAEVPIPKKLETKMAAQGMKASSPIMMRIFKQENKLEVWKRKDTGRYALLADYEICKWSGKFGPKFKEGDRQAPEGFYSIAKHQLNPKSQYHLSFNMGFPNAYDRAHGRTGSHLMVHGACSSAGCYSMTDDRVEEIYALAREALRGGQKSFQIQAYPFRLTAENLVKHRDHKDIKFWNMLKAGYDHFEITQVPPKVDVCGKAYRFNTIGSGPFRASASCPTMAMPQSLALSYTKKQSAFAKEYEALLAKVENREPKTLETMTAAKALPGIRIIEKKAEEPKEAEKTEAISTSSMRPASNSADATSEKAETTQ